MNINVSVIIPVYNAEKYLRECLKSLLNQTLSDIEIILSNDGSTDGSIPSIQDLIDSNAHIKLLENINQGAAIARNKGLEIAQGKYISFVDADDIVKPDFLKELFQACEKDDLDLVCGSFEAIHGDGRQNLMPRNKEVLELGVSNGAELFKLQIQLHNYIPMIWAYLYRREFLLENNLYLTRNTIHEDEEFSPRVWVLAKKARVIENYNYIYYRNHENSIIESRSNASIADLENSLQGFLEFQENLEFYQSGNILRVQTPWGLQCFRMKNPYIEKTKIEVRAWHLYYDSENYIISDSFVVDKNCNDALDHLNNATDVNSPFTTLSDV
ncbi:MAG: glycosyltransferase, partial [Streptococcaceae bacterium]|nr:glycosyltransferase [Streptococcaceae bacterium]